MSIIDEIKMQYKIGDIAVKFIFWNILLFAVPEILSAILQLFQIEINYINYISLSNHWSDLAWKPWSIISYAFFHSGLIHLIFNMLMLHFVGHLFLTYFTQKQLFSLYILGGIFSGLIYIISYQLFPALNNVNTSMIGASGAIMAILLATVSYQPFLRMRLLIVGTVSLWQIALVLIILDLIQLPSSNTGGHIAHLSGALFGFVYMRALQNGIDLGSGLNMVLDKLTNLFSKKKSPFKKVHVNPKKATVKVESRIVSKNKSQQQIDEILDKISQSGYDSLTKEEKEFLFKIGNNNN